MQTEWSFCPECQGVTQFIIESDEESCVNCGSVFEIDSANIYINEAVTVS